MRVWLVVIAVAAVLGWFALDALGSSRALARFAAQPVLELVRGDTRVPVLQGSTSAASAHANQASLASFSAIALGYRSDFLLPGGSLTVCRERALREMRCTNGWVPVRSPSP